MSIRLSDFEREELARAEAHFWGSTNERADVAWIAHLVPTVEQILTTRLEALAARLTAAETRAAWTKPSGGTED